MTCSPKYLLAASFPLAVLIGGYLGFKSAPGQEGPGEEYLRQQHARFMQEFLSKHQPAVKPLPGYLWSKPFKWNGYNDPGVFQLEGDISLGMYDASAAFRAQEQWKQGDKLFLCYDENNGVTLLDPASKQSHRVVRIQGHPHPIESYIDSLEPYRTLDITTVADEATRLWEVELARLEASILAMKHLQGASRRMFEDSVKARRDYLRTQAELANLGVSRAYHGGSIIGPAVSGYEASLRADTYRQLANLYHELSSFNNSAEEDRGAR